MNLASVELFSAELFPLDLKNSNNFYLRPIISVIHEHFQLKFEI